MRRLIIAIILLISLIFLCFSGYMKLASVIDEVIEKVVIADQLVESLEEPRALSALQDAYICWRDRQAILGSMIHHNELHDIENSFQRALQSLLDGDKKEYRLQSRELKSMLKHIPEMELPLIQNIF